MTTRKHTSLLLVLVTAFVGAAYRSHAAEDQRHEAALKTAYAFEQWAGKVRTAGTVGELNAKMVDDLKDLGIPKLLTHGEDRKTRLVAVLSGDDGRGAVLIRISRMESALAAHEALLEHFALCSAPAPVFRRPARGEAAEEVGDVCFVPVGEWRPVAQQGAIVGKLLFTRNNVFVSLDQQEEGKQIYRDLVKLAKLLDLRLAAAIADGQ